MALVPPHFPVDIESVKYQARTKLAELATNIADARRLDSKDTEKLILQATKIRLWLKALDVPYVDKVMKEKIVYCLIAISGIYDFPTAPVLSSQARPSILIGTGGSTVTVTNNYDAGTPFENDDVDVGTETVDSFATSLGSSALFHYTATNGTAQRSGMFLATWLGALIDGSEESTPDVGGSTDDLVLSVDINAGQVRFRATAASNNWSVSGKRYIA